MSKAAKALKEAAASPVKTQPGFKSSYPATGAKPKPMPKTPVVVKKVPKPSPKTTTQEAKKPLVVAKRKSAMETMIDSAKRGAMTETTTDTSKGDGPTTTENSEKRQEFLSMLGGSRQNTQSPARPVATTTSPQTTTSGSQQLTQPTSSLLYSAPLRGPEKKEADTSLKPSKPQSSMRPVGIGGFTMRQL